MIYILLFGNCILLNNKYWWTWPFQVVQKSPKSNNTFFTGYLWRIWYHSFIIIIINGSKILLLGLGCLFCFLTLYTVDRTLWMEIRPLQDLCQHKQNRHTHTFMPWVGFEPSEPSIWAGKDNSYLKPRSHFHLHLFIYVVLIFDCIILFHCMHIILAISFYQYILITLVYCHLHVVYTLKLLNSHSDILIRQEYYPIENLS